jgi:hypothetical protein
MSHELWDRVDKLEAQNAELVEALENLLAVSPWSSVEVRNAAHAAIAKTKEEDR